MVRGSNKDPFKMQEPSPMKYEGAGSSTLSGAASGAALGTAIAPGIGTAIGGVIGGAIGYFSGQSQADAQDERDEILERQRERAQAEFDRQMQAYQNMEFQTVNPYETMQVDLDAARFQRDQIAREQANTLQALRAGTTGAGAAALATAMSRQAAQKQQRIAAEIGQQEQKIKLAAAEQEAKNQQQRQQFNIGRMETMLGMSMAELTGIDQAALASEQAQLDRQSQLTAAGITTLGNVASSFGGQ